MLRILFGYLTHPISFGVGCGARLSLPGEGRLLATRVKTVNTELTGKTVGDGNHRYRLRWAPRYKGTGHLNSLTGITQRRG